MKNLLLLLLFSSAVPSLLPAQNGKWFTPGARWAFDYQSFAGPGTEYFEFKNMEMFHGVQCARVRKYAVETNLLSGFPYLNNYPDLYFHVRNDSVFLWDQSNFKLLYDFTRMPGDTLFSGSSPWGLPVVVTETGTTMIQGISLRYQKLRWEWDADHVYTTTITQRFGGNHLTEPYIASPITEIEYFLSCYRDNQIVDLLNQDCKPQIDFSYRPFPVSRAGWSELVYTQCNFDGYQFKIEGDSVIWGVAQGKKLYYRPVFTGTYPCPTASFNELNEPWRMLGLIYQTYQDKKVYFTRLADVSDLDFMMVDSFPPLNTTRLMYDFDVQPGQKLAWKGAPNVVDHIDSIQVEGGSWRRRYFFRNEAGNVDNGYFWIEGVGGSLGLFTSYSKHYTDVERQLRCFTEDNLLRYATVPPDQCELFVPVREPLDAGAQPRVYPNPASGSVVLQLPDGLAAVDVEIRDLCGRLLSRRAGLRAGERLDLPGAGVFVLRFLSPDGRVTTQRVAGR